MADKIYKSGNKWIVNEYILDAGSCIAAESADGLNLEIKLKDTLVQIAYNAYTAYVDASGNAYTKETLTALLDGLIASTTGASGTPAVIQVEITRPANTTAYTAGDVIGAAAAAVTQVSTVTLTGTGGVATVTAGGLAKDATFVTSLTQTATNFVTDNAAAYDAIDITLTSSGADLIFTDKTAGTPFTAATVVNKSGNIFGTIDHTTANVTAVKQKETVTVTGTSGTATITAAGGLTKTVTFATDLATTTANFATAFAADYLAEGIVVTNSGATIIFEAQTAGTAFTAPLIANATGDLAGTVAHTTANRVAVKQVETISFTGTAGSIQIKTAGGLTKTMTFAQDLANTVAVFAATNAADYLAQAIVLNASGDVLTMTAETAGTGFSAPTLSWAANNLAGTVVDVANVSLAPVEFANMATVENGGGILLNMKVESNITAMAEKDLRFWFYNAAPATVLGDNVAFVNEYADKGKLLFYVDITMNALLASSTSVIGQVDLCQQYQTAAASKSLYVMVQAISAFTPTSGGKINLTLSTLKL